MLLVLLVAWARFMGSSLRSSQPYQDEMEMPDFDPNDPDSPFKIEDVAHEIEDFTPKKRIYDPKEPPK